MSVSDAFAELVWAIEDEKEPISTVLLRTSNDLEGYLNWPEGIGYSGKIRQEIIDLKTKMNQPGYLDKIEEIKVEADRIRGELDRCPTD